jgi:hypothetical protein
LRNTAQIVERHVALLSSQLLENDEFVGMANFSVESTHDLPTGDSETISRSASSEGSHHPSRECFMAETSEGHVLSASDFDETPRKSPYVQVQEGEGSTASGGGLGPTAAETTAPRAIVGTVA